MHVDTTGETYSMDVKQLAHLVRMYIADDEAELFQDQLEQVLDHVRTLEAVDVDGVEPTAYAVPVHNVFREDAVQSSLAHETALNNAPQARQGLFSVPRILE